MADNSQKPSSSKYAGNTSRRTRREVIAEGMRIGGLVAVSGTLGALAASKAHADDMVWQIDPYLCTNCGKCADSCVLEPSAVKCIHAYAMCGYCNLCSALLLPKRPGNGTGAENQECPTFAIQRSYVEDPYYQYTVDEQLCIGCGICSKGCNAFGNGSMFLQIRHDRCVNCNQCSIANICPADAVVRVPASKPYILKSKK